jgi:hypothetical protein
VGKDVAGRVTEGLEYMAFRLGRPTHIIFSQTN